MDIHLYNTLGNKKELFKPLDGQKVRMYVCGPTVYSQPHLGNMRSVVVYDVLFRLLREVYGNDNVVYVRNITDVDDKIVRVAFDASTDFIEIIDAVIPLFHADQKSLNVLPPTKEIRVTESIPDIINMIQRLIDCGSAYLSEGYVLFDVNTIKDFGALSGRKLEDLGSHSRIEDASYKRSQGDFILWKPASSMDIVTNCHFESPWGVGRPGWHIECSTMSTKYLGESFDIHGGGADLMFPHHENEIAQCKGCNPQSEYARYWVHNGFLTVHRGNKMSKSYGNTVSVKHLIDSGHKGEAIRFSLLKTKYREPLSWSEDLLIESKKELDTFYRKLEFAVAGKNLQEFTEALLDDMNIPKALSIMHKPGSDLREMGKLLGILGESADDWFKSDFDATELVAERKAAKESKDWKQADLIRNILKDKGIILEDHKDGTTSWRKI